MFVQETKPHAHEVARDILIGVASGLTVFLLTRLVLKVRVK